MQKKLLILLQIFSGTLLIGSVAALVTCWIHLDFSSNLYCLYVVLPITLSWFITEKSDSILLFLLCGCLMIGATFLLSPKGAEQYLFSLITIIICGSFLFAKYRNRDCWLLKPHAGGLALFFCTYLFGSTQHFPYLCYLAHYFTIFYLLVLLVYTNQYRFSDFVQKNFQSAHLPYSRIRSINRLLITLITATTAIILFALPVSGMEGLLGIIKTLLVTILKPLFALLGGSEPPPVEEETLPIEEAGNPYDGLPQLEGTASPIWSILSNILVAFCLICLAVGIVKLLIYFVKNYHKHISKDGDQIELIDQKIETVSAKEENLSESLSFRSSDPNIQIRRLYKKRILSQRKQTHLSLIEKLKYRLHPEKAALPVSSHTPSEIEADSGIADATLHRIYEQARYSKKGCNKEDLAILKKTR